MDPRMMEIFRKMAGNQPQGQSPMQQPQGGMDPAMMAQAQGGQMPMQQPPMAQGQPNSFQFNPGLEQQAQGSNNEMHPMIQAMMQKMGLLSMLRNRSNQNVVDPSQI